MSEKTLGVGLGLWVAVVGTIVLLVSLAGFSFANGDVSMLPILPALSGLEEAARYIYLMVITGCIVGSALRLTRRLSDGRNR